MARGLASQEKKGYCKNESSDVGKEVDVPDVAAGFEDFLEKHGGKGVGNGAEEGEEEVEGENHETVREGGLGADGKKVAVLF